MKAVFAYTAMVWLLLGCGGTTATHIFMLDDKYHGHRSTGNEPTRTGTFEAGQIVLTNDRLIPALVCANQNAIGCYEQSTKTLYCLYDQADVCWHEFLHHMGVLDDEGEGRDHKHSLHYERMKVIERYNEK